MGSERMLEQDEQFKDWTFRYQYLYRLRRTNKQKQRFLGALIKDIMPIRQDLKVIEYKQNKKYISSNLYVGDIEKADRIICTYYDTPSQSLGDYHFFDRQKQSQGTTKFILLTSALSLVVGLGITILYMQTSTTLFDLKSWTTLVMILFYGVFFYLFSKVTKGLANRKNLIRNTSSVVTVLSLIANLTNKKIAFAFVDEGCFGELGLEVLKESCRPSATIFALDCVGAEAELHFLGTGLSQTKLQTLGSTTKVDGRVNYLFASRTYQVATGQKYYLTKKDLGKKTLNIENINKIKALFE